jgi:hypothetical protein
MSGGAPPQDDAKQQEQNLEIRKALGDAYSAVEGAKSVQSFSALTFEDLADQQIQRISGPGTDARPNELDRVQRVLGKVLAAVASAKSLPAASFAKQDPARDVNTPAAGPTQV